MPVAQQQSDTQNKSTRRWHPWVNHITHPHFLKCEGTVLLYCHYYYGSQTPLCPSLWRSGVFYLPCLRTRDARSIILLIWTGKCLKNLWYEVLQSLLVICRYEKEKWGTSHCFEFTGSRQNRGIHICIYRGNGAEWKPNICKNLVHSWSPTWLPLNKTQNIWVDRTICSMENSHPKAYLTNKEKQTLIFFPPSSK